jgi:hypothetical protein
MFTYNERDLHRMPTPARSHLPIKDFIAASGILDDENSTSSSDADVALLRLPAPSLRGTFAKAYVLLAKLVSFIGWDELLKARSQVFVMEEEYRMHRATDPVQESPMAPPKANGHGDDSESVTEGFGPLAIATDDESDSGSIHRAERSSSPQPPPPPPIDSHAASPVPTIAINGEYEDGSKIEEPSSPGIPTIKVSTDSDGEREREELRKFEESDEGKKAREVVGKPPGAKQPVEETEAEETGEKEDGEEEEQKPGAFQNKRLCERWLDNLFMVLYEVRRLPFLFFSLLEIDPIFLLFSPLAFSRPYSPLSTHLPSATRTFAFTPSGGPKSLTSRPNTSPTARPAPSGRSSASSLNGFTTRRSRKTLSSAPSIRSSRRRRGRSCSSCTPMREMCRGA